MAITGRSFPSHTISARNTAGTIVGAARGSHTSTGLTITPRRPVLRSLFIRNPIVQQTIVTNKTTSNIYIFCVAADRRQPPRTMVGYTPRTPLAEVPRLKASGIHVFGASDTRRQPPRTMAYNWKPLAIIIPPPINPLALQFIYFP